MQERYAKTHSKHAVGRVDFHNWFPDMQTQSPISIHVLVADTTRMYTELLADALGRDRQIRVISAAPHATSILESVKQHKDINVVVLGSHVDEIPLHGIALLREIRALRAEIKGVVLLDTSKKEVILDAFRAGAKGLFSRHEPLETLGKCVRQVHAGQIWANSEQLGYAVEALASSPNIKAVNANGLSLLSKRELEVVRSLAEGLTNREIAEHLGLSQHTIKNYLFRIFDKLGVSSRMELLFLTLNQSTATSLFPELATKVKNIAAGEAPSLAWYYKSAGEGVVLSQLALARMLSGGDGTRRDPASSYMWYLVVENSCKGLKNEISAAQKSLEGQLSTEEISEARRKAEAVIQQMPSAAEQTRLKNPQKADQAASAGTSV